MARKINRWRSPRQTRLKEKPSKTISARNRWFIVFLSWLALASFCFTIPPQRWWQIAAGLLLLFASLFLTVKAASQNLLLSLTIASLIAILAILGVFDLLTPAILILTPLIIILIIILIIGNHLL